MTAQLSNRLINNNKEVALDGLSLYGVIVGNIKNISEVTRYPFKSKATKEKFCCCTVCWNGYISQYTLTPDKELILTGFDYPLSENAEPDEAYEKLSGNFWLDMRPDFFSGGFYIPFKDGKLVTNKRHWIKRNKSNKLLAGVTIGVIAIMIYLLIFIIQ